AFDLDLGRLHLGFGEIVQDARTDERDDETNDCDDDQHFDQRETALAVVAVCTAVLPEGVAPQQSRLAHESYSYPTIWLTEISAVITETINPPTITLMTMMASGPTTPMARSRLRCSLTS